MRNLVLATCLCFSLSAKADLNCSPTELVNLGNELSMFLSIISEASSFETNASVALSSIAENFEDYDRTEICSKIYLGKLTYRRHMIRLKNAQRRISKIPNTPEPELDFSMIQEVVDGFYSLNESCQDEAQPLSTIKEKTMELHKLYNQANEEDVNIESKLFSTWSKRNIQFRKRVDACEERL